MADGFLDLKARPIREVRASCGCVIGLALVEGIDTDEARLLYGQQFFVVPCAARLTHVVLMRDAHEDALAANEIVDLEQVLVEFEKLIGGT